MERKLGGAGAAGSGEEPDENGSGYVPNNADEEDEEELDEDILQRG